ncbi:ImmA/IrrE family metallo-endopeptidase [Clostridium sp. M14]|uniref:ImmA/IrrE family metallo-endopeptidase n=1 Tax=Clostridium sp. M14 TaxID=2716311 RepID=UPI0013EEC0D6|nr:ImmA/IrrE family metallo-endopeptidase [Clostridium sp. M14]MBZ9690682.1 ImmA/IrrE family metallo-endopeptidase [Clostridium sp. M14]
MGWEWINKIVINLKKNYLTNSPYELCRSLNIEIVRVKHNYFLLYNRKSTYFRNINNKQIIFIVDDLYGKEEEFILRHELGHAILHPNIQNSRYCNTGKIDRQADYFALLLTDITFDSIKMNEMTISQISSCINVPFEALSQLVNL